MAPISIRHYHRLVQEAHQSGPYTPIMGPNGRKFLSPPTTGEKKLVALPPSKNRAFLHRSLSRKRRANSPNETSDSDTANTTESWSRLPTPARFFLDPPYR